MYFSNLLKKNLVMKKKIIYSFLLTLIILVSVIFYLISSSREFRADFKEFVCSEILPNNICQNLYNSYNVKFLPETQLANLELKKLNLDGNYDYKKFFLEIGNNKLIIIQLDGYIRSIELDYFSMDDTNKIVIEDINSNLTETIQSGQLLGLLIHKNNLYASYSNYSSISSCNKLNVAVANIESDYFKFNNLIKFDECQDIGPVQGGRLQPFIIDGNEGLLLTTSQNGSNFTNIKAQDDNSIFGKVLFIDLNKKDYIVFAKGLRNPQGLYVKDDLVIATEHGPKGGDEINKILKNKNYGWPDASYGETYGVGYKLRNNDFLLKNHYKRSHSDYGYEEPLYAFVPSIGISEIINVPNTFHPKWSNNFLISSLGSRSLYRVRFDDSFDKVLLTEQIYIGERIRDLIYSKDLDLIFLALEDYGQLGILKSETYKTQ